MKIFNDHIVTVTGGKTARGDGEDSPNAAVRVAQGRLHRHNRAHRPQHAASRLVFLSALNFVLNSFLTCFLFFKLIFKH